MRKVIGLDPKISADDHGDLISVSWNCPYCGEYNAGFYGVPHADAIYGDFETDQRCDRCGEMVTIECKDVGEL